MIDGLLLRFQVEQDKQPTEPFLQTTREGKNLSKAGWKESECSYDSKVYVITRQCRVTSDREARWTGPFFIFLVNRREKTISYNILKPLVD